MIKSIISILISVCTALLVLFLIVPTITQQPEADKAQSSLAKLRNSMAVRKAQQRIETAMNTVTGTKEASRLGLSVTEDADPVFSIENIIDATNAQRIQAGLPPLKTNTMLNASAKIKSDDMLAQQYFEHVSPTGKNVANLGRAAGYQYIVLGENLALGNFTDANDLLTAWMNSPGHRANILNKNYQDIGVYAEKGQYKGREVWFAVQHFGTQRSACPGIDDKVRQAIATENANLKSQENDIAAMRTQIEAVTHPVGTDYQNLVAQFNDLVKNYNDELAQSQGQIDDYNAQVKTFNGCLSKYQKKKA